MADEVDYKRLVREVRDWAGNKNSTNVFHSDAKDKSQHSWWLQDPHRFVPENMLPAIKASYNFSARFVGTEEY